MEGVQQAPLLQEQLFDLFIYLGAEWVLELLVILSVISVAITAERLFHFLSHRDDYAMLQKKLDEHLCAGDVDKARALLQSGHSYVASICLAGLDVMERGPGAVEEMMTGATKVARLKLERGLAFLGTLGNNAPFIGLFGTVIGIIQAFEELGHSAAGHGSQAAAGAASQVASGAVMSAIAEALVVTAVGIAVALPAVAAYNYLQRRVEHVLAGVEVLSNLILAYLESNDVSLSSRERMIQTSTDPADS